MVKKLKQQIKGHQKNNDGGETCSDTAESEDDDAPPLAGAEAGLGQDGMAVEPQKKDPEPEPASFGPRLFRLTKIANDNNSSNNKSATLGRAGSIPIPSFSPSKVLSQEKKKEKPKTRRRRKQKPQSSSARTFQKKDATKRKEPQRTAPMPQTPPRNPRPDHVADDDDDALPSPPFSNSQTITTVREESKKESKTTKKRPRASNKMSNTTTTKRKRSTKHTRPKTTATAVTEKNNEEERENQIHTVTTASKQEHSMEPIPKNAPTVWKQLAGASINQPNENEQEEPSSDSTLRERKEVSQSEHSQNNTSTTLTEEKPASPAASLQGKSLFAHSAEKEPPPTTMTEKVQDAAVAMDVDDNNNKDKCNVSVDAALKPPELSDSPSATDGKQQGDDAVASMLSQNISMSAVLFVEVDDDEDEEEEDKEAQGGDDDGEETTANELAGGNGSSVPKVEEGEEKAPSGESPPIPTVEADEKVEGPSVSTIEADEKVEGPSVSTIEADEKVVPAVEGPSVPTVETEEGATNGHCRDDPSPDILLEIDDFLKSDAGRQQQGMSDDIVIDVDDDEEYVEMSPTEDNDHQQKGLQFSHHRTPRQVSDGSSSSTASCLLPTNRPGRKPRGVAARRSACAMCSTCPCSRGGVDKLGGAAAADNDDSTAVVTLGASRTDAEVERALMARLARLEKSAAWFHFLCGKVRRELKKHKLRILRQRAASVGAAARGATTAAKRFLDDAEDLDRDVYRNPMIPPAKPKEAVQRATEAAFGKDHDQDCEEVEAAGRFRRKRRRKDEDKTGDAQQTLTQMVGPKKKDEDPNNDAENHKMEDGQKDMISVSSSENEWDDDDDENDNNEAVSTNQVGNSDNVVPAKFTMESPKCDLQRLAPDEEGVDGLWATAAKPADNKDREHSKKASSRWMNGLGFLRGQRQAAAATAAVDNANNEDNGDIDTLLTLFEEEATSAPSSPAKPDSSSNIVNPYKKRGAAPVARRLDLSSNIDDTQGNDTQRVHRALDRLEKEIVAANPVKWQSVLPQWRHEVFSFVAGASQQKSTNLRQACHETLQQARTTLLDEWTAQSTLLDLIQEILPFL